MCGTHVAHISTPITSPTVNHPAANIPKVLCPHRECLDLCFPAGRWGPIQYYEGGFNVVAVGYGAFFLKKYNTKTVLSTKHFKLNQLCIHSEAIEVPFSPPFVNCLYA